MGLKDVNVGGLVELYEFDFSHLGGSIVRCTNSGGGADWNNQAYQANPVESSDLGSSIQGTPPSVQISVSNINGIFTANLVATLDFVGGRITRTVIDRQSVGTSDSPVMPPEIFTITNVSRGRSEITFLTSTQLGTWNIELPTKKMLIDDYPGLGRVY